MLPRHKLYVVFYKYLDDALDVVSAVGRKSCKLGIIGGPPVVAKRKCRLDDPEISDADFCC